MNELENQTSDKHFVTLIKKLLMNFPEPDLEIYVIIHRKNVLFTTKE